MRMKMSSIGIGSITNKNNQKVVYVNDNRMQNPFYRKNLLIKREDVLNQVQLDLSGYRTKARSTYESNYVPVTTQIVPQPYSPAIGKRVSFGPDSHSPNLSNGSLIYSPTPR